jgi:hypothetical protein
MRPIKIYALAKAVTKFPQHACFAESARAIFNFFFKQMTALMASINFSHAQFLKRISPAE